MEANWQAISNIGSFDTPLMAVYPDRVRENIKLALEMAGGQASRLRPHIKTHKTAEILQIFLDLGITKVKCATIAEAELAATAGIPDVMLAYQPVGFKIDRFLKLAAIFPNVNFSCLVDNLSSAARIGSKAMSFSGKPARVFIDLNTGMNRTGYDYERSLPEFYQTVSNVQGLRLLGLHIYDGHLHHNDPVLRIAPAAAALAEVRAAISAIVRMGLPEPLLIAGGSNTFSYYAQQSDVECSPGTFVFWDKSYTDKIPELDFKLAAVLIATVISMPGPDLLCLDLGYKSVSSENPIDKRVLFPWNPDLKAIAHSEEHLVLHAADGATATYHVGQVIYGIPYHICPSVALYDELSVVNDQQITGQWAVAARRRKICL
jgi:D-serine deaminase-like pyridoxal phosphate-dependent protein